MAKNDFQYDGWNSYTMRCDTIMILISPCGMCNVACGSVIVTVNSPSGSTLQCDTWLWDDMPLNSSERPPYWNSTFGFDFEHITAVDMSFCNSLRHFIQIGPPSAEKNDVMSIFTMADLSHLGFYGSNNGFFEKPNYNLLNCLVFQKIAFLDFGVEIQDGGYPPSSILGVK